MRWNELGKFLIISLAIIGGFIMYINPLANSIKQGLDLQGGTHVVLQAVETPEAKIDDDALNRTVKIIERRVNELGLTEPVIQRQGKDRIIVELPGIKDPDQAINMLGRTAMLEFKDINGTTVLTGKDLRDARAQMTGSGSQAVVGLEFEGKYHNAYELYIDLATAYDKCPVCNKVCSDSFWSYKTFGIGAAYKPTISRGKNSNLRWRFGADLGANRKGFQASIDIGLEYSYSFRNGMQVFVMQKNDFVFWTRDHFRNGLLVGVKFPINK